MIVLPLKAVKYFRHSALCLVSVVLMLSQFAQAATEVDLYNERVVVSQNANQQEQNKAITEAFSRIIVRVTGIEQSLVNPAVQEALQSGDKYLATFRFEPSSEFFTNVLGEKVPTKAMILSFDRTSVDDLLVQNRLPVWGAKRPEVLIWLADRLEGQDHILADGEGGQISTWLTQTAQNRGIPLILPIMDLNDSLALSFADVYGLFSSDIEKASKRYNAPAILAGRLAKNGNDYKADWLLMFKGERIRMPSVFGSQQQVIAQGVDLAAQRLSEQYALVLDPMLLGNLTIKVLDVYTAAEFTELEAYLESINLITKATVAQFDERNVVFNVEISGDKSQLADVLALDSKLQPVVESSLEAQLDNNLIFTWSPN